MKRVKVENSDDEVSSQVDEIEDWSEFEKVKSVPASQVPLFDEYDGASFESDAETQTTTTTSVSPLPKVEVYDKIEAAFEKGMRTGEAEFKVKQQSRVPMKGGHFQWTQQTENEYNRLRKAGKSNKEISKKFGMSATSVTRLHSKLIDNSLTLEWNDGNCAKLISVWKQKRSEICGILQEALTLTIDGHVSKTQVGKQFLCLVKDGRAKMN